MSLLPPIFTLFPYTTLFRSYTLTAGASGVSGGTSAAFSVTAGAPSVLVFSVQPTTATAGAAITPAVQVTAQDAEGNVATGFAGSMSVTIGSNAGGGTLSGTTTAAAVAGVAAFPNLSINKVGTGYTLTAAASALTPVASAGFNITPGPAIALGFTVQPGDATAGAVITPAVRVTAEDAQGNVATAFSGSVTVALGANPGGGTLAGTATVNAANGLAAFSGLSINKAGSGYTLTAAATGLRTSTSAAFTITVGALVQLVFTVQPTNVVAGATIAPAVQVTGQDAQGNTVTAFSGNVTVAIGSNPGGGTLTGTTTVAAVSGVATFPGLSINKLGSAYNLTAAAAELTQTSAAFNVTPGGATQLAFTVPPSNAIAGAAITPAVQVTAQDALGNTATAFGGSVTVAIGTNPGGGTLSGTTSLNAVNGVATFAGLNINRAGAGYTLAASAGGLGTVPSPAFNVTAGAATQLVFTVEPSATVAGAAIAPAVQVTAQDALGNTDPSFTGQVTVALGANPGSATLSGTTTSAAANGVATFTGLSLDKTGTGYTLTTAAGGLTGATSNAFNVTAGAATQLVFSVQPTSATAGSVITPAVQLTAQDAQGNTVTGFTGNVTVALGANPGSGTLSGTKTVPAVAGVATFGDLSLDKAGTGYTLTAAATGLTTASSTAFNVTPGTASQLVFTVEPTATTAAAVITPAVQVTAQDPQGNTATVFTGNVTVALGANPGSGVLAGTATVAAVGGVASFAGLSVNKTGNGYTLTAAATGLTPGTSTPFNITPGAAAQLVFNVQPSNTTAGSPITPAVQVTAQDAQGNTATQFTANVTVALGTNPGGGALSGTTTLAAAGGVATLANLSINKVGTGYTLTAAATSLATQPSAAFNVTPGAAAQLVFSVEPSNATAGTTIAPAIQVTALDAQGNVATGSSGSVTVGVGTNAGGGILSGTTGVAAVSGIATFANLSINKVGTGYTLAATATGVTPTTSTAFNIAVGTPTQLVFSVQPSNAAAGAAIEPAVQVTAQDAQGNTATQFSGSVTVTLGTNLGGGTLSGTTTIAAVGGVAAFNNLSIDKAGTGYTLAATATGLSPATSVGFNVAAGAASRLVVSVQPTSTTAGVTIAQAVQVTALDAEGNTATGFSGNVTAALGTNPGEGTLSGTATVAAVAGVATFSTLSIDKIGTGYKIGRAHV